MNRPMASIAKAAAKRRKKLSSVRRQNFRKNNATNKLAIAIARRRCRYEVRARFGLSDDIKLVVGVERFDYTKGIIDRMHAIEALLERPSGWKDSLVFVQVAAPTRSKLDSYSRLQPEAEALARDIYARQQCRHGPIIPVVSHWEQDEIFKLFRAADACIVSSLHDGMNLVAKEFVAARDDEMEVLVLSSFTGASREMPEALIVNPYDTAGFATVIDRALNMPAEEQRQRMLLMRTQIKEHNVYRCAASMPHRRRQMSEARPVDGLFSYRRRRPECRDCPTQQQPSRLPGESSPEQEWMMLGRHHIPDLPFADVRYPAHDATPPP